MRRLLNNCGELMGLFELGLWFLAILVGPFVWMYLLIKEAKWVGFCVVLGCWIASAAFVGYAVRHKRFPLGVLVVCIVWLIAVVMVMGFRSII
jgi:hypothetical protein